MNKAKEEREETEIWDIKASRQKAFEALYRAYLSQFTPFEWVLLPAPREMAGWSDVMEIVRQKPYNDSPVSFDDILSRQPFGMRIDVWKTALEQCIVNSPSPAPGFTVEQTANLASTVYTRKAGEYDWRDKYSENRLNRSDIAVNWEGAQRLAAVYGGTVDRPLFFDEELSRVSAHLITMSGLDPATATSADMDASVARFDCISERCRHCLTARRWNFAVGHKSRTWRELVSVLRIKPSNISDHSFVVTAS